MGPVGVKLTGHRPGFGGGGAVVVVVDDEVDVLVGSDGLVELVDVDVDVDVLGVEVELDVVEDVDVVWGTFTSGPVALHRDSARMMSKAGSPGTATDGKSRMWTPRTMMLVFPGELLTI